MAYPRYDQPLVTSRTRLRLPAPSPMSPLYSSGWNPNQVENNALRQSQFPSQPSTGGIRAPGAGIQRGEPIPGQGIPLLQRGDVRRQGELPAPTAPLKPKLEVSPYMETIYKSIQNIDPEQREEYLQTTAASIKDRLDRYEFRIARGIPLTPEQQRQYDSIRGAYNDIQKYINNPVPYDEMFAQRQANIEQARMPRISGGGTPL